MPQSLPTGLVRRRGVPCLARWARRRRRDAAREVLKPKESSNSTLRQGYEASPDQTRQHQRPPMVTHRPYTYLTSTGGGPLFSSVKRPAAAKRCGSFVAMEDGLATDREGTQEPHHTWGAKRGGGEAARGEGPVRCCWFAPHPRSGGKSKPGAPSRTSQGRQKEGRALFSFCFPVCRPGHGGTVRSTDWERTKLIIDPLCPPTS